jgi:hypothetical protein
MGRQMGQKMEEENVAVRGFQVHGVALMATTHTFALKTGKLPHAAKADGKSDPRLTGARGADVGSEATCTPDGYLTWSGRRLISPSILAHLEYRPKGTVTICWLGYYHIGERPPSLVSVF